MEENNKVIIISSYDEEVRYYKDLINGKECRNPIFTGVGESGKSTLFKMVENGDVSEAAIKTYFNLQNS